ncbi:MAG TPA: hypothetical protein VM432_06285 [Bdellovibrionales bacterium]|jgi:DNA-directed RNA polymerase specialized sigma24 family protein|nr:hypothetical protein [Bdellovibrionales bacterium]
MRSPQDERARKIALFFLFSLADERVALHAAHKAIAQFKASSNESAKIDAETIKALRKIYEKHKGQLHRESIANAVPPSSWNLPAGVSANAWLRFHKNSSEQEIVALVLSKILALDEDDVAQGLGVSPGTVRYRVGKALRQLGSFTEKEV